MASRIRLSLYKDNSYMETLSNGQTHGISPRPGSRVMSRPSPSPAQSQHRQAEPLFRVPCCL